MVVSNDLIYLNGFDLRMQGKQEYKTRLSRILTKKLRRSVGWHYGHTVGFDKMGETEKERF